MCAGVDGIVHLGGQAVEADWETVLQANIVGCYNLFEAARRQGVKRIVFATTNHVIGFYRRDAAHRPPRPAAAGQPLRRQQGVRRGARARSTPTSTASGCSSSGSAISATGRSTGAACRSGSARATSCSWSGSASSIPTSTSRSSTAPPRTTAPGGTIPTPTGSATGRRTSRSRLRRHPGGRAGAQRSRRRAVPGRPVLLGRIHWRPERIDYRLSRVGASRAWISPLLLPG